MSSEVPRSDDAAEMDRGATGKRILLTILFILIARAVELVVAVVVLFELAFSLITKRTPSDRVVRFGHRAVHYGFAIGQYVTFNEKDPPFPFDDFPNGAERIDAGSTAGGAL